MNKQKIIHGKNTVSGLLLCVLAWMFAILPAQAQGGHWTFDDFNNPFENYMTINAYIVLDGIEIESDQFEIAAFIGGECRGTYTLEAQTWSGHNYPCFLSVWGKTSETGQAVTVKVYDHSTGTEYEANEKPLYEYNGNLGGFDDDGNVAPLYRFSIGVDPNNLVYNLTVVPSQNGSVSADATSGLPGTVITLTVSPAMGYELDAITVTGSDGATVETQCIASLPDNTATYTFVMPASNVTVEASFKKTAALIAVETAAALITAGSYTVTQEYSENEPALKVWLADYINSLPGMSETGITLTAGNIAVTSFTAASAGTQNSVSGTNGSFRFTVSLSQGEVQQTTLEKSGVITAKGYVEPAKWSVTVVQLINGTVSANPDVAEAGATVTLTVSPATGYELNTITVAGSGGAVETQCIASLPTPSVQTYTFVMPAYPVTVNATFKKTEAQLDKEAVEAAKTAIESGTYRVAQATANDAVSVKAWLADTLNVLFGQSHDIQFRAATATGDVTVTAVTPATAGTESATNGVNGSFTFNISLAKGAATATATFANGVIIATPHVFTPVKRIEVLYLGNLKARIINTGNVATGDLTLALSGANADVFTISGVETQCIASLPVGGEADITLIPNANLAAGTYTATLTVSGDGLTESVTITYIVTPTGIDSPQAKALKACVQNGTLHVGSLTAGNRWAVYNLSGALIYSGISTGDEANVYLQNRGVYIVTSGNKTVKVIY